MKDLPMVLMMMILFHQSLILTEVNYYYYCCFGDRFFCSSSCLEKIFGCKVHLGGNRSLRHFCCFCSVFDLMMKNFLLFLLLLLVAELTKATDQDEDHDNDGDGDDYDFYHSFVALIPKKKIVNDTKNLMTK